MRTKTMIRTICYSVLVMGALFVSVPAVAQYERQEQPIVGATAPSASFQSTSAMQGTGSAYSSNPTIGANGTATYEGASYAPAHTGNGARKIVNPPDDEENPIGDAALPLILLALAYAIYKVYRKKTA